MKRANKVLIIALLAAMSCAMTGFDFKRSDVTLLDSSKLIDLDKAIEKAEVGQNGNKGDTDEETEGTAKPTATPTPKPTATPTPKPTATPTPKPTATPTPKPTATPTPTPTATPTPKPTATPTPTPKPVPTIKIRDINITVDGTACENADALKQKLTDMLGDNGKAVLVDDFAEAHVYREVMAVLDELGIEYAVR